MILTDQEISDVWYQCGLGNAYDIPASEDDKHYARAIEAAVIAKLAVVSVEPMHYIMLDGACIGYYSKEQLAAARVQAINECADVCESMIEKMKSSWVEDEFTEKAYRNGLLELTAIPIRESAESIRALIGGKE